MVIYSRFGGALLVIGAAGLIGSSAAAGQSREAAEAKLDRLIDAAIDGHQFFTPEERAVIERACGYAPGSWSGVQVNMVGTRSSALTAGKCPRPRSAP